jgi:hypothetical protein
MVMARDSVASNSFLVGLIIDVSLKAGHPAGQSQVLAFCTSTIYKNGYRNYRVGINKKMLFDYKQIPQYCLSKSRPFCIRARIYIYLKIKAPV